MERMAPQPAPPMPECIISPLFHARAQRRREVPRPAGVAPARPGCCSGRGAVRPAPGRTPAGATRRRLTGGPQPVGRYALLVPPVAVLGRPLARGVIDPDQPEPHGVTLRPFEVVHEAPQHVAPQLDAPVYGGSGIPDVLVEMARAPGVVDGAVGTGVIGDSRTVFRDVQGHGPVLVPQPDQDVGQAPRVDLPTHGRHWAVRAAERDMAGGG